MFGFYFDLIKNDDYRKKDEDYIFRVVMVSVLCCYFYLSDHWFKDEKLDLIQIFY